jgi:RNA polymerase sigma-70 factor (ECF subfamily)
LRADSEPKPLAEGATDRFQADDRFVRSLARRLLRDPQTADDAAQDTWLAALLAGPAPGLLDGLTRGWLATVVRNFALQTLRGRQRRLRREQAVARGLAVDPEAPHLDPELVTRVQAAVAALPADYRAVVHLRFFADLMPVAIADELGVPVETVRTRLKRAVERLRALLLVTRASSTRPAPAATRSPWTPA